MLAVLRQLGVMLLIVAILSSPSAAALLSVGCCCDNQNESSSCCAATSDSCCSARESRSPSQPQSCCQSNSLSLGCQPQLEADCCFVCSDCDSQSSELPQQVVWNHPLDSFWFSSALISWNEPLELPSVTAFDHSLPTDLGPPIRVRFAVWLI